MSRGKKSWCVVFLILALWTLGLQAWVAARDAWFPVVEMIDPLLPIGALDSKYSEINSKGIVTIHGWALHPAGVAEARVYIDGKFASRLELRSRRPDVLSAYPNFPGALHSGFRAKVLLAVPLREQYEIRIDIKLHNGRASVLGPWNWTR